jgi:hypothetical protein
MSQFAEGRQDELGLFRTAARIVTQLREIIESSDDVEAAGRTTVMMRCHLGL